MKKKKIKKVEDVTTEVTEEPKVEVETVEAPKVEPEPEVNKADVLNEKLEKLNAVEEIEKVETPQETEITKVYALLDKVVSIIEKQASRINELEKVKVSEPKTVKTSVTVEKKLDNVEKTEEPEDITKARGRLAELMKMRDSDVEEYNKFKSEAISLFDRVRAYDRNKELVN